MCDTGRPLFALSAHTMTPASHYTRSAEGKQKGLFKFNEKQKKIR
jgi:hypothetical protein